MHGWAGSGEYFNGLIDHLDLSQVRAITYDMRGHGDSDKPDVQLTLERLARDGLAVADAAGARTFVAVGFSMSGKFAQYLAVLEPARVEGLVLIAGAPAAEIPLPPELLADWYARSGRRRQVRRDAGEGRDHSLGSVIRARSGYTSA